LNGDNLLYGGISRSDSNPGSLRIDSFPRLQYGNPSRHTSKVKGILSFLISSTTPVFDFTFIFALLNISMNLKTHFYEITLVCPTLSDEEQGALLVGKQYFLYD